MTVKAQRDPYEQMVATDLPKLVGNFIKKSGDYGPKGFQELGVKGQYSEIHRKVGKLKRVFWDGKILQHESPQEVVSDLFGHILILHYLLRTAPQNNALVSGVIWPSDEGRCETRSMTGLRCRKATGHQPETAHQFT